MAEIAEGHVFGNYKVLELLGQGGMAAVYRAESLFNGDRVAVKVMAANPDSDTASDILRRFEREAQLMISLKHPHILPVYDFGEQDGYVYLVMKCAEGDLHDYLLLQPVDMEARLALLKQIADALEFAHQHGVVHRDLKPPNVLMVADHAYLSDFGIAKFKEESVALTQTGMIVGTPSYMAPEQWRSEPLDQRTDVYAFGVMAFEVLSGHLPFETGSPFTLMYAHLDEPPPPISHYQPKIPRSVDRVINRALEKIPEHRYASTITMVEMLVEAFKEEVPPEVWMDVNATAQGQAFPTPHTLPVMDDEKTLQRPLGEPPTAYVTPRTTIESGYNSVDVGARALLERAREAMHEGDEESAALAAAVSLYVQELRDLAKQPLHVQPTPYRALESYDVRDNKVFFGREVAIEAMLERSPFARFTVLHAESGAGKTSLLRAGLMPRLLAGGFLPLYVAVRRTPPHEALKSLILPDETVAPGLAAASLRTYLKALSAVVGPNRQIFLFIDQFETFFSDVFTHEQRQQFINELAECLDDSLLPVRVTLAMRTEFFGMLASFQPQVSQPFANEFLLRALKPEEAERALVLPAKAHGYTFEDDLPQTILADLGGTNQEIAPPQLQLVGGALIDLLPADRKLITAEDYQKAGRAEGVLRSYLERLLERFSPEDRRVARRIIEGLVRADQTRDVRTEQSLRDELTALNVPTENFEAVLNALRENRVLRLVDLEHQQAYELVHDYLARQVELDPETAARKAAQELLDRRVSDYENYGSLLTNQELAVITAQAQNLSLNNVARELIQRTEAARLRQRRILIGLVATAMIALVGIMSLGLFAAARENRNRQERLELAQTSEAQIAAERDLAELERDRANEQTLISQSGQVALQSLLEMDSARLESALLLSVQARHIYDTRDARSSLLTILQNIPHLSRILYEHPARVRSVAYSPAANIFASADGDGNLILWDGAALTPLWRGQVEDNIWSVAFSPDGAWLLTGDNGGNLTRWETASGEFTAWAQLEAPIFSVAISPDGQRIAAGDQDGAIRLWDAQTQALLYEIPAENLDDADTANKPEFTAHSDTVYALAFSPDNTLLASGSYDQTILLTDIQSEPVEVRRLTGHTNWVIAVAFSPDGETLASGSTDNTLRLWNIGTGDVRVQVLSDHRGWVRSVIYSADGQYLITGSGDRTIIIRSAGDGQRLEAFAPLVGHGNEVFSIALSSDATQLVSGDEDGRLLIWSLEREQLLSEIVATAQAPLQPMALNPQQNVIYAGGEAPLVQGWDVETGESVGEEMPASNPITTIEVSPDGQIIAYGDGGGKLYLWEIGGEEPYAVLDSHFVETEVEGEVEVAVAPVPVRSIAFSPDGTRLVSGGDDGLVKLWDVATGTQIGAALAGHTDSVRSVSFSPDGSQVISGGQDTQIMIWDAATQQQSRVLPAEHTEAVMSLSFSPDGRWLVSSSRDRTAVVWDWASGTAIKTLVGHTGAVHDAAFSPDGTLLATASQDDSIILWDTATWQPIGAPLQGHIHFVWSVQFSPDNRWLYSVSQDASLRRWAVAPTQWEDWACSIVNRPLSEGEWTQLLPFLPYAPACEVPQAG